jgi:hypothetical protein
LLLVVHKTAKNVTFLGITLKPSWIVCTPHSVGPLLKATQYSYMPWMILFEIYGWITQDNAR